MIGGKLMETFIEGGKSVTAFFCNESAAPAVYVNAYADNGAQLYSALKESCNKPFDLIVINNLNWDSDMAPWDAPAISKTDTPCTAGADSYLATLVALTKRIEAVRGAPPFRVLAGYSLAGLFALYAPYKTPIFSRIASVSGSLWFPNIVTFIKTNNFIETPKKIFMSLGDKESNTRNKYLKTTQENTKEIFEYYKTLGIDATFTLNAGNHFNDALGRTARAIITLL